MAEQLIKFFVVFFVVVEPISLIPLFAGLTSGAGARYKKKMAGKAAAIALIICVLFALVGAKFLDVMGISLSSFRIAGGTLLFLIALDMVFARTSGTKSTTPEKEEAKTRDDISVFSTGFSLHRRPRSAGYHFAYIRRAVGETPAIHRIPRGGVPRDADLLGADVGNAAAHESLRRHRRQCHEPLIRRDPGRARRAVHHRRHSR